MNKARRRYLEMIKCRAYGHAWEDRGWLPMIQRGARVWEQLLTCPRCAGQRHDKRSHGTLTVVSRYYERESDYPGNVSQHDALQILIDNSDGMEVAL